MPASEADQYRACESGQCGHDLARAVGIIELWGGDGPFRSGQSVLALPGGQRLARFSDDEAPAEQQRWAV